MAPAARRAHGILTGIAEFKADAATLKLICHRVSFDLTGKNLVAANLVIHSPVKVLSGWGGFARGQDPQRLDLKRKHSASIGRRVDFEYHLLYWATKEAVCQKVSICYFE